MERLVCLAVSYVRFKNIWPSKPRDNRSGTEGKLHGIFESGIQAVWLGSRGSAGLLFGSPELGGKARHGKGSGNNVFWEIASITEVETKGNRSGTEGSMIFVCFLPFSLRKSLSFHPHNRRITEGEPKENRREKEMSGSRPD